MPTLQYKVLILFKKNKCMDMVIILMYYYLGLR